MYINTSLKYHISTGTQSRVITKVYDLLGQPSYYDVFPLLKVVLILKNSADPDEMHYYAPFNLGLCYLPKYPFRGFHYTKG